jgi:hypothetical protein
MPREKLDVRQLHSRWQSARIEPRLDHCYSTKLARLLPDVRIPHAFVVLPREHLLVAPVALVPVLARLARIVADRAQIGNEPAQHGLGRHLIGFAQRQELRRQTRGGSDGRTHPTTSSRNTPTPPYPTRPSVAVLLHPLKEKPRRSGAVVRRRDSYASIVTSRPRRDLRPRSG